MRDSSSLEVEHRGDLAADLGQRLERLGVEALLLEQPRVDECGRDVRGELPQNRDVALGVPVALAAEDVQRADRLRLVDERHGQRGHASRARPDVARVGRHVAD